MSVKRVTCPGCNAALNVPTTMTHVKCSACGMVWDTSNPAAAQKAATPAATAKKQESGDSDSDNNTTMMIVVAGTAFAILALAGIGVVLFTGGKDDPKPVATPTETVKPVVKDFKIVKKLSEETRKKLYYDYRQMADSTVGKKGIVPKDSAIGKVLGDTMDKLADRETTHFSLLYNITEDEVMDVVNEGDAKGWPPNK